MNHMQRLHVEASKAVAVTTSFLLKKQNQKFSISIRAEDTQPGLMMKVPIWPLWKAGRPLRNVPGQDTHRMSTSRDPHAIAERTRGAFLQVVRCLPHACLFKPREAQEDETRFAWPPYRGGGDSARLCVFFLGPSGEDCSEMNGNGGRDNASARLWPRTTASQWLAQQENSGGERGEGRKWKMHEERPRRAGRRIWSPAYVVSTLGFLTSLFETLRDTGPGSKIRVVRSQVTKRETLQFTPASNMCL